MISPRRPLSFASLALAASFMATPSHAAVFTYQARLDENGAPKAGTVDLRFDAFAIDSGGAALNVTPAIRDGVPLTDGVFTVEVDFGANVFTGAPVFVQVGVREDVAGNASTLTGFTDLVPRQAVTATPYAQHAANVGSDAVGSAQIANNSITAGDANTTSASDGLQRRVSTSCAVNNAIRVINSDGTVVCDSDDVGAGAAAWGLSGNSGTDPATNFLGTTDARPIELRSNGQRVARLESIPITIGHAANVLMGSPANSIDAGVRGATIAGGGAPGGDSDPDFFSASGGPHRVRGHYGTVGGGYHNTAGDVAGTSLDGVFATVGGGSTNTASGNQSTVGGGFRNTAAGELSAVGGGLDNVPSGFASTVGGGRSNSALSDTSTVSGGFRNCAGGETSWAGGTKAKVRTPQGTGGNPTGVGCDSVPNTADLDGDEGTFVWADSHNGDFVSQGPDQFVIRAAGGVGIQPGNLSASAELANVPEAPLHVFKGSAGAGAGANQDSVAVFESNTSAYISILSPVADSRGVVFGEEGDNFDGGIIYNPDNSLHLRANGDVTRLAIEGDGSVGIGTGTTAVSNALHVLGGGTSVLPGGHAVQFQNAATTTTNSLLGLKSALTGNVGSATNFITFFDGDNDANGAIEGNASGGVVYKTSGADYAEWLPRIEANEAIAPGELVGLHAGGRVSKRLDGALQVLIASTGAAVAGNSPGEEEETTHSLIAFVGQVKARVCGTVHAGDAIIAKADGSGCGVARDPKQLAAHEFARVAGTAWEGAVGEGEHRVQVAVGLGSGDAERATLLSRIDALETKLGAQQALVDALLAREARAVVTSAR